MPFAVVRAGRRLVGGGDGDVGAGAAAGAVAHDSNAHQADEGDEEQRAGHGEGEGADEGPAGVGHDRHKGGDAPPVGEIIPHEPDNSEGHGPEYAEWRPDAAAHRPGFGEGEQHHAQERERGHDRNPHGRQHEGEPQVGAEQCPHPNVCERHQVVSDDCGADPREHHGVPVAACWSGVTGACRRRAGCWAFRRPSGADTQHKNIGVGY